MLIVAGHLTVRDRERYLEQCREVVEAARSAPGCLDFALGADLAAPDRVNVYERWADRASVDAFRGQGTSGDEFAGHIVGADVREFTYDDEVRL
ncbi:putative quinol monooxygenase [Nocardia takedensis]|uniref:putative quinol monooxygenase n=1 Tax=Nocardia takedensis TaxID=259390 RepID=UPI000315E32F|nr:antibiotic biosynthesis monooxygenase family protein [Nocardia takedensis]